MLGAVTGFALRNIAFFGQQYHRKCTSVFSESKSINHSFPLTPFGSFYTLLITAVYFAKQQFISYIYVSRSVMSNSLQSHRLYPARLLCPWNSPGIFPTQGLNPGLHSLVAQMVKLYHLYFMLNWDKSPHVRTGLFVNTSLSFSM